LSPIEQLATMALTGQGTREVRRNRLAPDQEWITVERPFLLRRKTVSLPQAGAIAVGDGLQITAHPQLKAQARLASVSPVRRTIGGPVMPRILIEAPSITAPVQFATARNADDPGLTVLEFVDVNDHTVV